jgi:hypothetical protein
LANQTADDALSSEISALVKSSKQIDDADNVKIGVEALTDAAGNTLTLTALRGGKFIKELRLSDLADEFGPTPVRAFIDDVKTAKGLSDTVDKILRENTLGDLMDLLGVASVKNIRFSPAVTDTGADAFLENLGLLLDEADILTAYNNTATKAIAKGIKDQAVPSTSLGSEMLAGLSAGARKGAVGGAQVAGQKVVAPFAKYGVGSLITAGIGASIIAAVDWIDDPQEPIWVSSYGDLGDKSAAVKEKLLQEFTLSDRQDFYNEIKELTDVWFNDPPQPAVAIENYASLILGLR